MTARPPTYAVDFGKRSSDYAEHRPGFPPSFYDRLETFIRLSGKRVLDLGTGPGLVALELAARGANVVGIDIASDQIRAAEDTALDRGLSGSCRFLVRPAEETCLAGASFDLITAGQCWGWFDEARTLREMQRVLAPGGLLAVAHYCYLSRHSDVARATEDLVLRHNPGWTMAGHDGLYPRRIDALIGGGFELVEQFCYDHDQRFTHESWRGRMRTCNGVGSGWMSAAQVEAFDRELERLLTERYPAEPLVVKHRIWCAIVRQPRDHALVATNSA